MPQTTQTDRACVACRAPVRDARCPQCGVAQRAGGFQIERVLAQTPHSRVYLAKRHGEEVALKELLFAMVPQARDLDAFEREARLLQQLSHPRIPRFVASFREGEGAQLRLYLAQQFVPGGSLLDELQRHRFDEEDARRIAREVLGVLTYLHGLSPRIIHRDIKPANLMRASDGHLMLVDFGAARNLMTGATYGATMVGTFGYMPPEQLGGTVDETSDLYALGATLLHLLSGKAPDELIRADLTLDFAESVNVSPQFLEWLRRMVARERSARFRTAQKALQALDAPPSRVRSPLVVGIPLAAAIVAAGAVAMFRTSSAPAPRAVPAASAPVAAGSPRPLPTPTPAPMPTPARRPERPRPQPRPGPKVDEAEVIELPRHSRKGPPLLREDRKIDVRRSIQAQARDCPTPPSVEIETAQLQVEGPGSLSDPRSRLYLEVNVSNRGGQASACERALLELRAPGGGRVSEPQSVENGRPKTVAHRSVSFTFPRTLPRVELCVGGNCAVTLDLANGSWAAR